jgi:hypothetical protein
MGDEYRCPRCSTLRLAVLFFDAEGKPIGGHVECPSCGPRYSQSLEPESVPEQELEQRKAS